jgi:hypothetical protein
MPERKRCLDFVGIGAARSATTWLSDVLAVHPEVFVPSAKELHYFNNERKYRTDLENFWKHFEGADNDQKWGEVTPRYILDETALARLRSHFPDVRVICVLRDPVARAFSQYCFFRFNKMKEENTSFEKAIKAGYREDYINKSRYGECMERVFQYFERHQVLIIDFDELLAAPEAQLNRVSDFIGVSPINGANLERAKKNASSRHDRVLWSPIVMARRRLLGWEPSGRGARRAKAWLLSASGSKLCARLFGRRVPPPELSEVQRRWLFETYFQDDVEALERLLGRSFDHWKQRNLRRRGS